MNLTREQALLLAGVGVAAVAVLLLSPLSPLTQAASGTDGYQGVVWSPYDPVRHVTRGGLYHQPLAGAGRTALITYGWDWICNPPSELQGPGYGN